MPQRRTSGDKPLLRKFPGDLRAKLSSRSSKAAAKKNKKPAESAVVHLHHNEPEPPYLNRPIPWWVSTSERALLPGGLLPGGPGPGQVPGQFPPPPPFQPGPGPGQGQFPPPPPPFQPGPGPGPGPGPFPIPLPIPLPIPGPGPLPGARFVTVAIRGGAAFPNVNFTNFIPYYPGITIRQALESTGLVGFGPFGFIVSVAGIPVTGRVNVSLRYNGRIIPQTLLSLPAELGSTIELVLFIA